MIQSNFPRFHHSQIEKVERLCPTRPLLKRPILPVVGRYVVHLVVALFIVYTVLGFLNLR